MKIEDNLKKFENGKRPQKNWKCKKTSKNLKMEDDLKKLKMEDDLKKFENERRPQNFWKWKTTSKIVKMEDDLKKYQTGRWPYFFLNEDDLKNKATNNN